MMHKLLLFISLFSCSLHADEALEALGERIFSEHRFAKEFLVLGQGNINHHLKAGSASLKNTPFSRKTHSCASCHMVDQNFDKKGMRGYNDFSSRSPILSRSDKKRVTLRNTPTLIDINSPYYPHNFVHYDAEVTLEQTVLGNITGRNMGWQANEESTALANAIDVIRKDNGQGSLAQDFGGSYTQVLKGTSPSIPSELRLSKDDRLDVKSASDEQILNIIIKSVLAYMNSIQLEKDEAGNFTGSVYDKFLIANAIDTAPEKYESPAHYTARIRKEIQELQSPKFIPAIEMSNHKKAFAFNKNEFEGMKIFFNIKNASRSRGMCIACHLPPMFSDGLFHNIGTAQKEYDLVHGEGSFNKINVPSLKKRNLLKKRFLPSDKDNPEGQGLFASIPSKSNPLHVDLGLWNVFARANKPDQTDFILKLFCFRKNACKNEAVLPELIGRFKTATLRNLGHSAPYHHNGSEATLLEAVNHYVFASNKAKKNELRNPDHALGKMSLTEKDAKSLTAFLNTLNENYE